MDFKGPQILKSIHLILPLGTLLNGVKPSLQSTQIQVTLTLTNNSNLYNAL